MSRTSVIVSDSSERFVENTSCRLCMKNHGYYFNIFISNEACKINMEKAIRDLLCLKVTVGDGLPSTTCLQCVRKLVEYSEFKEMCLKSDAELRRCAMGNDVRTVAEDTGAGNSKVDYKVPREEMAGNELFEAALPDLESKTLNFGVNSIKKESGESAALVATGEIYRVENVSSSELQGTEVYIPIPDQLSMGNTFHVQGEFEAAGNALVVKEECLNEGNRPEINAPVTALSNVALNPLAVDDKSDEKEDYLSPLKIEMRDEDLGENECSKTNMPFIEFRPHVSENTMDVISVAPAAVKVEECTDDECTYNDSVEGADGGSEPMQQASADQMEGCHDSKLVPERPFTTNTLNKNVFQVNDMMRPDVKCELGNLCKKEGESSDCGEYVCNYCGNRFVDMKTLAIHIKGHTIENVSSVRCSQKKVVSPERSSSLQVRGRESLRKKPHGVYDGSVTLAKSSGKYKKQTGKKPFKCEKCGMEFNHRVKLCTHQSNTHGDKTFKCEVCDRSFALRCNMLKHQVTHTGVRPYKCIECGKEFNRSDHLKKHRRTRTGYKPFKCEICGNAFTRRENLKTHASIHVGLKPFKCEHCGKVFNRKENLKTHIATHTSLKPFMCDVCGRGFCHRTQLKDHLLLHAGLKPFKCATCGKVFTRKCNLRLHTSVHSKV